MQNTRSSLRGSFLREWKKRWGEAERKREQHWYLFFFCFISWKHKEVAQPALGWSLAQQLRNYWGRHITISGCVYVYTLIHSHAKLCSYPFGRVCLSFINLTCKVQPRWPVTEPVCIWPSLSSTGPQHPWRSLADARSKPSWSVEFELSFRSRRVRNFCYSRLCLLCWNFPICFSLMWGFLYDF